MAALLITLLCTAELILFLLPGVALVTAISRKRALPPPYALIAVIAASAAFGYVAFWIYLASEPAGQIFSYAVLIGSLIMILAAYREKRRRFLLQSDFIVPLGYALCLGLFYLSLLYLFVNPIRAGVDVANVRFFPETRPGDNIIPFIFAERIYDHAPIRPFCCGDWLSSDRPPLQAGIFLLQRPLRVAGNTGLQYQVLGTMLQCLWVCGIWTLLRATGASLRQSTQALGLLVFSGFLFYNSVYVWPKLLAAAFILFVFSILARAFLEHRAMTRYEVVLAALCFVLALLAHPGSVFSTPAIVIALLWKRNFLRLKRAVLAVVILVVAIAPWTLYQKFYDPPGNRLLKMHLAGVMEPDSRSTFQAFRDAYAHLSVGTILKNKWENIQTVAAGSVNSWRGLRVAEREYIAWAIGVLNLGWIVSVFRRPRAKVATLLACMVAAAVLNLLVWCMVLFGPGYTTTEHGSYADILLLSLALAGFVLTVPRLRIFVLSAQVLNLVFVWVIFRPQSFTLPSRAVVAPSLQWPMLILAICVGGALFWRFASTPAVPDALFEKQPQ